MSISLIGKPLPSSTVATTQELRDWLRGFGRSGVVSDAGGEFEVTSDETNLTLDVATGRAIVDGIFCRLDDAGTVTLAAADATNDRIDRVVLRLDPAGNGSMSVQVRQGTPAGSPVAPALTQSVTGVWEEVLADVLVGATATTIPAVNVTDRRTFLAKFLANDPLWDAAGDIAYATGADAGARLALGTAGQALVVNAGATAPEWADAGGGMEEIASGTLSGASLAITSIPGVYSHLYFVVNNIVTSVADRSILLRCNADSGSNYGHNVLRSTLTTVAANDTDTAFFPVTLASDSSPSQSSFAAKLHNYTKNRSSLESFGTANFSTGNYSNTMFGVYRGSAPVTQINLLPSSGEFSGGTYTLYGVK